MTLRMKAAVLDEVIKRLRSGEYRQGQSALRQRGEDSDRYCCLGVMCEIAVEEGVIQRGDTPSIGWPYSYGPKDDQMYLPDAVVDWAGIEVDFEKDPDYGDYYYEQRGQASENQADSLAVMNDSGKAFPEIADWMEANVVPV